MVTIKIPSLWRSACQNEPVVQVPPGSLLQVLQATVERYPLLRQYLFTPQAEVHPALNFFVNREHVRYQGGLQADLRDGDEIHIVPLITGGSQKA
jgi:molybdopterin synthase sulfur carrier subunit